MTIKEMIQKNPSRSSVPPGSIFEVQTSAGEKQLMCWTSFIFGEVSEIASKHPDFLEWQVTKEHFTSDELKRRCRPDLH